MNTIACKINPHVVGHPLGEETRHKNGLTIEFTNRNVLGCITIIKIIVVNNVYFHFCIFVIFLFEFDLSEIETVAFTCLHS